MNQSTQSQTIISDILVNDNICYYIFSMVNAVGVQSCNPRILCEALIYGVTSLSAKMLFILQTTSVQCIAIFTCELMIILCCLIATHPFMKNEIEVRYNVNFIY